MNFLSAILAIGLLGGLALLAAHGWRGALLAIGLSALLAAALVCGAVLLAPQPVSPAGRGYAVGVHMVAAMDVMIVGLVAVGLGAATGAAWRWFGRRRLASREPS